MLGLQDAQKKKQAAEKREREALEKSRKDRDALFAKQVGLLFILLRESQRCQ